MIMVNVKKQKILKVDCGILSRIIRKLPLNGQKEHFQKSSRNLHTHKTFSWA